VGTTIVVVVLILVVLVFIWLSTTLIARRVEKIQGRDTCSFCGAPLEQAGIEHATHCTACGRQQPWDDEPAER
jgi:hypothetical protein